MIIITRYRFSAPFERQKSFWQIHNEFILFFLKMKNDSLLAYFMNLFEDFSKYNFKLKNSLRFLPCHLPIGTLVNLSLFVACLEQT